MIFVSVPCLSESAFSGGRLHGQHFLFSIARAVATHRPSRSGKCMAAQSLWRPSLHRRVGCMEGRLDACDCCAQCECTPHPPRSETRHVPPSPEQLLSLDRTSLAIGACGGTSSPRNEHAGVGERGGAQHATWRVARHHACQECANATSRARQGARGGAAGKRSCQQSVAARGCHGGRSVCAARLSKARHYARNDSSSHRHAEIGL